MVQPIQAQFRRGAIRELLEREGLSLSNLARRLRITRQRAHGWMMGDYSPQFPMVLRMCAEFGVDPMFFAEFPEPEPAETKKEEKVR
ncbi:MAG: helix-turn-helix transcriptional regulator [Phycisphaerae bacterium]|nr:helix-turn-helix transcriptional regulator [Phycisphaerae bacterium]